MSELGHNTLNTSFTSGRMHCTNPNCFDDTCKGECQESEDKCYENDCDCQDQQS